MSALFLVFLANSFSPNELLAHIVLFRLPLPLHNCLDWKYQVSTIAEETP
ncbi:hypothetical protein G4B88_022576 [Cannabis sativa]|uniref:Uncharacterized protein n=1 Tax=Cannabis sativa TaxID=3483 RepID=A0A7J6HW66_CANSA|nr:hypothetical protein G4B88_010583 [Cannabis sativa]KAF4399493.1 hypothetical protein G4B88_022576 [Cannabis sativa]